VVNVSNDNECGLLASMSATQWFKPYFANNGFLSTFWATSFSSAVACATSIKQAFFPWLISGQYLLRSLEEQSRGVLVEGEGELGDCGGDL
jgi:hypothetical protein